MIYHVITASDWQQALQKEFYEPPSLLTEGFIHFSKEEQVAGVVERYYKNAEGLLLLHVDETKLPAHLKFELSPSVNEEFPHLYARLNVDAVTKVTKL